MVRFHLLFIIFHVFDLLPKLLHLDLHLTLGCLLLHRPNLLFGQSLLGFHFCMQELLLQDLYRACLVSYLLLHLVDELLLFLKLVVKGRLTHRAFVQNLIDCFCSLHLDSFR